MRFSAVTRALRPRTALTAVNITPGVARRGFAPAYEPLGAKATHCHTRYGQCHPRLANDSSWGARFASIHRARMCRRVVPTVNGVPPSVVPPASRVPPSRHCTFLISGQLAYHTALIFMFVPVWRSLRIWLFTSIIYYSKVHIFPFPHEHSNLTLWLFG